MGRLAATPGGRRGWSSWGAGWEHRVVLCTELPGGEGRWGIERSEQDVAIHQSWTSGRRSEDA